MRSFGLGIILAVVTVLPLGANPDPGKLARDAALALDSAAESLASAETGRNRIAALTFGPRYVIVLAGRNKLVADLEGAWERIKSYAAPVNSMRLGKKTPCAATGFCQDCKSPQRICNTWTITEKSFPKGRVRIVLINDDLAF